VSGARAQDLSPISPPFPSLSLSLSLSVVSNISFACFRHLASSGCCTRFDGSVSSGSRVFARISRRMASYGRANRFGSGDRGGEREIGRSEPSSRSRGRKGPRYVRGVAHLEATTRMYALRSRNSTVSSGITIRYMSASPRAHFSVFTALFEETVRPPADLAIRPNALRSLPCKSGGEEREHGKCRSACVEQRSVVIGNTFVTRA